MKALSHLFTVMRGSVAGITYTANASQSIVARARVSPVNPSTAAQTFIRTAFSFAIQRWESMTQLQRDAWQDYAESLVWEGPCGTYDVPGRQVFLANASFLQFLNNAALATITVFDPAPIVTGFSKFDSISSADPAAPGTGFDLNLHQATGVAMDVLINISLGFNPTRNRFKGPWADFQTRYIQLATGVTANIPITGLVDGQAYFYRIRGVTNPTGHRGTAAFIGRHVAATNP